MLNITHHEDRDLWKSGRGHRSVLLVYLTLLSFLYSFALVINVFALTDARIAARLQLIPEWPEWAFAMQALCGGLNLVWIAAIFFRQRIGFYGLLITSLFMTVINMLCQFSPTAAGLPLVLVVMMYALLQWGTPRSTWAQMR